MNLNETVIGRGRGRTKVREKALYVPIKRSIFNSQATAGFTNKTSTSSSKTIFGGNNAQITPRTSSSSKSHSFLDSDSSFILAVTEGRGEARCEVGIAAINISRPSLTLCQVSDVQSYINTLTKINIFNPTEILVPLTFVGAQRNRLIEKIKAQFSDIKITPLSRSMFNKKLGLERIQDLCLSSMNSIVLILQHKYYALAAAAALLLYAENNLHIYYANRTVKVKFEESEGCTTIDILAADKLELVACARPNAATNRYTSLFGVLNRCVTKIGARTLRSAILQPCCSVPDIEARLDCVTELIENPEMLESIQSLLLKASNIDQILTISALIRLDPDVSSERQLNYALRLNVLLSIIEPLREILKDSTQPFFVKMVETLSDNSFNEVKEKLSEMIHHDGHPAKGQNGILQRCFAIKSGINGLLDLIRKSYSDRLEEMREHVKELADKYGMELALCNNNQKGYHIVLTLRGAQRRNLKKSDLPPVFIQVYRLTGSMTMKTETLMNLSTRLESIVDNILSMSNVMIHNMLTEISRHMDVFHKLCEDVAHLDLLQSLAKVSCYNRYVRPKFGDVLELTNSRHPILEYVCPTEPIPNSIQASEYHNMHIITGPNGSGKSIFIRQLVLIQVMAQIGCYVPASSALLRVTDRIFARIYLEDNMEYGASTFTFEMKEIQYFLMAVTKNSLIILDELCRSTSAQEGMALAMAISEKLMQIPAFIFSTTHFRNLTELGSLYCNVKVWHLETTLRNTQANHRKLVYKYNVLPGVTPMKKYSTYLVRGLWPDDVVDEIEEFVKRQSQFTQILTAKRMHPKLKLMHDIEAEFGILKSKKQLTRSTIQDVLRDCQNELEENCIYIRMCDDEDDFIDPNIISQEYAMAPVNMSEELNFTIPAQETLEFDDNQRNNEDIFGFLNDNRDEAKIDFGQSKTSTDYFNLRNNYTFDDPAVLEPNISIQCQSEIYEVQDDFTMSLNGSFSEGRVNLVSYDSTNYSARGSLSSVCGTSQEISKQDDMQDFSIQKPFNVVSSTLTYEERTKSVVSFNFNVNKEKTTSTSSDEVNFVRPLQTFKAKTSTPVVRKKTPQKFRFPEKVSWTSSKECDTSQESSSATKLSKDLDSSINELKFTQNLKDLREKTSTPIMKLNPEPLCVNQVNDNSKNGHQLSIFSNSGCDFTEAEMSSIAEDLSCCNWEDWEEAKETLEQSKEKSIGDSPEQELNTISSEITKNIAENATTPEENSSNTSEVAKAQPKEIFDGDKEKSISYSPEQELNTISSEITKNITENTTSPSAKWSSDNRSDSTSKLARIQRKRTKFKAPIKKDRKIIAKKPLIKKTTLKFIPPKMLSKKAIEKDFQEQRKKLFENYDSSNASNVLQFIKNTPTVRQIQETTYIAQIRRTNEGVIVIPPTKPKKRLELVDRLNIKKPDFDVTIFSDKNSKEFEAYMQGEVPKKRPFFKSKSFTEENSSASKAAGSRTFSFGSQNYDIFGMSSQKTKRFKPNFGREIQETTYIAQIRRTNEGVIVIPPTKPKKRLGLVDRSKIKEHDFDVTLFSDESSKEFEAYMQGEVPKKRTFFKSKSFTEGNSTASKAAGSRTFNFGSQNYDVFGTSSQKTKRFKPNFGRESPKFVIQKPAFQAKNISENAAKKLAVPENPLKKIKILDIKVIPAPEVKYEQVSHDKNETFKENTEISMVEVVKELVPPENPSAEPILINKTLTNTQEEAIDLPNQFSSQAKTETSMDYSFTPQGYYKNNKKQVDNIIQKYLSSQQDENYYTALESENQTNSSSDMLFSLQ